MIILRTIKRRSAKWFGHIVNVNYLTKCVIEGRISMKYRSDGKTRKKT